MPSDHLANVIWLVVVLSSMAVGMSGLLARRARFRRDIELHGSAPQAGERQASPVQELQAQALAAIASSTPQALVPTPAAQGGSPVPMPDVPAALLRVLPSGKLLDANPAACALLGLDPELLLAPGRALPIHESSRADFHLLLARAGEGRGSATGEIRMLHGSGRNLDITVQASVEATARGAGPSAEPACVLALFDISALRRSERALAFRESRYRSLVEDQADVVSLATTDGVLTFVNRAYAAHFGLPPDALVGRSIYDFIPDEDRAVVRRHLRNVTESGKVSVGQNRLLCADGREIWMEWTNRALPDSEGRMTVLHSVGRDITERLQAERAIQLLNHEQMTLMNSELIGIAKICNRRFMWVSRGLSRIFGYEPQEFAGASTRIVFFDQDSYARLGAEVYPRIRSGKTWRGELEARHASGEHLWLETSAVMFDAARDESLWVYADVSPRKRAEIALRQALDLEARQRQELAAFRDAAEAESALARFLLQRLSRAAQLDQPGVAYHWQPAETFSGDLLAVSASSTGDLYGMLADATGHGLAAAINLVPLGTAFYAMAAKGFGLATIAAQLNQVVKDHAMPDRFVAVTLARIQVREKRLEVANAGNPAALLLDAGGALLREFASGSVPFGVLEREQFRPRIEAVELAGDEQLLLLSDGVTEAGIGMGAPFGTDRLRAALAGTMTPAERIDAVREALDRHTGAAAPVDDISLLLLAIPPHADPVPPVPHGPPGPGPEPAPVLAAAPQTAPETAPGSLSVPGTSAAGARSSNWALALHFSADQLRQVEAVPVIVDLARTLGLPQAASNRFFAVLSELFANALEHGVLQLDSALKAQEHGFECYAAELERRLQALQQGHVQVDLWHSSVAGECHIVIAVSDSGAGFDHRSLLAKLSSGMQVLEAPAAPARGFALLQTLCDRIEFNESGNVVTAEFHYR